MADIREPVAWVNSARMSGNFYMYVEGASDERFWNKFIDQEKVKIQVCQGCYTLQNVVDEHIKEGVMEFIAVTDSDFHALFGTIPQKTNLFVTDEHDIEMMMYRNQRAFHDMLNSIDRGNKILDYELEGHDLLEETMQITSDIGYCKIAVKKKSFNLDFTKEDKHTHDIIRPKYEDALDGKTGDYFGLERIVSKVYGFNSDKQKRPKEQDIVAAVTEEKNNIYDKWHLSNGHDVSILLSVLMRRRCKHRNMHLDCEMVDSVLYSAYNKEDFIQTKLYAAMDKWSKLNRRKIFK